MTKLANEETTQSRVVALFGTYASAMAVHFLVAAALIFTIRPIVTANLIYNWGAAFTAVLVLSLILKSMFNSKVSDTKRNFSKWENIYAIVNILFSLVFTVAYSYVAYIQSTTLLITVTVILVMQVSCLIVLSLNSRKTILGISLPTVLPFCGALVYFTPSFGNELAVSLGLFTLIFLALTFNINRGFNIAVESNQKLTKEVKQNEQLRIKLESNSFIDLATNIYNRRFFDLMIDEKIRRAKRVGNNLSLAIIELDFFDEYRAHYGQEKASKCMQRIANILSNATHRGGEYMTCFDDNKFALIASNVPTKEAVAFTGKMRQLIDEADIEHRASGVDNVEKITVSVGISEFQPGNIIDVDEIILQALFAVETAHTVGHNNIQVYDYKNIKTSSAKTTAFNSSTKPYLVSERPRSA
ncbi:MAG: GGDEF domain-containing protein [Paraglaciecola sp.]|uniref:GGDEF domain-containing protein n=1 Tax=Paraglaciecola sp. TaxID=1920173 RepID=UPI003299FD57